MSITPVCARCGKELTAFGGLLFSPPDKNDNVRKTHLCKDCYYEIMKFL